jgi:hypothetical protein
MLGSEIDLLRFAGVVEGLERDRRVRGRFVFVMPRS